MQLTCGGNDVVRYLIGIGLWLVYVLLLLFIYHCFISSIAFIILPMYYGRFLSEIKLDWLIDWYTSRRDKDAEIAEMAK